MALVPPRLANRTAMGCDFTVRICWFVRLVRLINGNAIDASIFSFTSSEGDIFILLGAVRSEAVCL